MVRIIVAVSENNAIGKNNSLLFSLKGDMQNFKKLTTDNIVIMGRKTFESIGKPLPNRTNIVVSRKSGNINDDTAVFVNSLEMALEQANKYAAMTNKTIYIIGGGQIYKEALEKDMVDEIILTRIKQRVEDADTFFPSLDSSKWSVVEVESYDEGYEKQFDISRYVKSEKFLAKNLEVSK